MGISFVKGHGSQNDFVLLPDPQAALELTTARVAALCDRRRGLGADGVLRAVPRAAVAQQGEHLAGGELLGGESDATWFMDYRNADGSLAQMCGNGIRVFARYLVRCGYVRANEAGSAEFAVATRAGDRAVTVRADGTVSVAMGTALVTGEALASVAGRALPGTAVSVGNPHLVCRIDQDVNELDLTKRPRYDANAFPEGVNVEFLNEGGGDTLDMRVYERGVGETRACGTGAVAATAATLHARGVHTGSATVQAPGGPVVVTITGGAATLTGPAVFVAHGEISGSWWEEAA